MSDKDASVVLAHGAWADGSSWSRVIARLSEAGIDSIAAPLPLATLEDDVAALEGAIDRVDGPVVLVGHAYAGAVIGAVQPDRIKALVYVAALAPDEGETVADVFYRSKPHPLAPKLAPDVNGRIWLPVDAFATAFAQNASKGEQALLAAVQRPIAPACISVPVPRPLWRDIPSWYFVAEEDRMIPAENQRFMSARIGAKTVARPVDHAPLVTAADAVTDLVLNAVRS